MPQNLFVAFEYDQKVAIHIISNLCIPPEVCKFSVENIPLEAYDDREKMERLHECWSYRFAKLLTEELLISQQHTCAYLNFSVCDDSYVGIDWTEREKEIKPYLQLLIDSNVSMVRLYATILRFLLQSKMHDGRGSVLMRNLSLALQLSHEHDGIWIEHQLTRKMLEQQEKQMAHTRDIEGDKYRYTKIAAAAVGAGVVLAVTGGLVSSQHNH